ncbi:MAG: hypothetical protein CMM00_12950, partial [Rhodopirellula sp.]|nr:hypothetical protein [Rhodopirellula sp.]
MACVSPLAGRSARIGYPLRTSGGGHSSWLDFLRRTLSFPISIRFIPALPSPEFSLNARIPTLPNCVQEGDFNLASTALQNC